MIHKITLYMCDMVFHGVKKYDFFILHIFNIYIHFLKDRLFCDMKE